MHRNPPNAKCSFVLVFRGYGEIVHSRVRDISVDVGSSQTPTPRQRVPPLVRCLLFTFDTGNVAHQKFATASTRNTKLILEPRIAQCGLGGELLVGDIAGVEGEEEASN